MNNKKIDNNIDESNVSNACVYTILKSSTIDEMIKNNENNFSEKRKWSTAYKLFYSDDKNTKFYLILAPSESTRYLYAYAIITDIILDDDGTQIYFKNLTKFNKKNILKTTLTKYSDNENVLSSYIRPYLICNTKSIYKFIQNNERQNSKKSQIKKTQVDENGTRNSKKSQVAENEIQNQNAKCVKNKILDGLDVKATYDEILQQEFTEGKKTKKYTNQYERNPKARKRCLEIHGYSCFICSFNFEKTYGKLGENFIHVHHIIPISKIAKDYIVDPEKDLIPVCPNCHAMLHRDESISVQKLKKFLKSK